MKIEQDGSLLRFTLRLTLCGPVFIGSGQKISKKEYCFSNGIVYFYNTDKLLECIVKNGLQERFEAYMLGTGRTLDEFFKQNGGYKVFQPALEYKMPGSDAIQGTGRQPADIWLFHHSLQGAPYIPGSSVKGMLRTAITAARILQHPPRTPQPQLPAPYAKNYEIKKAADKAERMLDTELFHTLGADAKRQENAVNSIFRGLMVADSAPLQPRDLVLCRKLELFPQGGSKPLNVIRQCLRPGLQVDIPVVLDSSLCGSLTPQGILDAVRLFDAWYNKAVFAHYAAGSFPQPRGQNYLFLGGGSGFQSKTVTGPWLGSNALPYTAAWLQAQFGRKNSRDKDHYGISPHILKCTEINNRRYLFGHCEVAVL